jgi:predicted transcriptional regulator
MMEVNSEYNWNADKNRRNQLIIELKEQGESQQDISRKLNVSQGTVSNVLSGKSTIRKKDYSSVKSSIVEPEYSDVDTIFEDIATYSNMVISGFKKALLITGMSGMGKTFTVQEEISNNDFKKDNDYAYIKGKITPQGLYTTLYLNRDRLTIFDDSDSVWDNQDSVNILKHALDTNDDRSINWISSKEIKNPLYDSKDETCIESPTIPTQFDYDGSIIFISNKFKYELDPAFLTRTLKVDLNLTLEDTLNRIEYLLPSIGKNKETSLADKKKALEYMKDIIEEHGVSKLDISLRSYIDVLDMMLHGSTNWKRLALQQCLK